ncbi:MAG: MerR family transcriptional regulator, partial [Eggerthellaceae bacterium]
MEEPKGPDGLYTMTQVCNELGMSYQTLKFYCNQGLVPNVKRDDRNRRVFSARDVEWVRGLTCLKRCGMSIEEMREYLQLCLQGESSIPQRKVMLAEKRERLEEQL